MQAIMMSYRSTSGGEKMKAFFAVITVLLVSLSLLSAFLPETALAAEKKITVAEMTVIKKAANEAVAAAKLQVEKAKTEEEKSLAEELLEYANTNAEVATDLLKSAQDGGSVDRKEAEQCAAIAKAVNKAAETIAAGDTGTTGGMLDDIAANIFSSSSFSSSEMPNSNPNCSPVCVKWKNSISTGEENNKICIQFNHCDNVNVNINTGSNNGSGNGSNNKDNGSNNGSGNGSNNTALEFFKALPGAIYDTWKNGEAADSLAGSVQAAGGFTGENAASLYGNDSAFNLGQNAIKSINSGLRPYLDYSANFASALPGAIYDTWKNGEAADSITGSVQGAVGFTGENAASLYGNDSAFNLGQSHPEMGAIAINAITSVIAIESRLNPYDLMSGELWGMGNSLFNQATTGNGSINVAQVINSGTAGVIGNTVSHHFGGSGDTVGSGAFGGVLSNGTANLYGQMTNDNPFDPTNFLSSLITGVIGGGYSGGLQNKDVGIGVDEFSANLFGNGITSTYDYVMNRALKEWKRNKYRISWK
jgi:hypothetical protein